MKKFKVMLITTLVFVIGALMLVACGGSKAGVYKLDSVTVGEQTYKIGDELPGMGKLDEDTFGTLELKDDGTFVVTVGGKEMSKGDWKEDGDNVVMTANGVEATYVCDGSTLTQETEGMKIVYKK